MEGLLFFSLLALVLGIVVLVLTIVFLYKVPKHLEDIALTLKRMYLFGHDDDDDDDCCHPADAMTDRINNCETLK